MSIVSTINTSTVSLDHLSESPFGSPLSCPRRLRRETHSKPPWFVDKVDAR